MTEGHFFAALKALGGKCAGDGVEPCRYNYGKPIDDPHLLVFARINGPRKVRERAPSDYFRMAEEMGRFLDQQMTLTANEVLYLQRGTLKSHLEIRCRNCFVKRMTEDERDSAAFECLEKS
jgi:hypothetical protein